ncbi:hypothetical protein [Actinoplanes sp. NPDC051494]|uniref:hypothetical protein n=1 Tax=Actinoplanes sp. NPDC051494 TaxID=3363907 RepID=UPI003793D466
MQEATLSTEESDLEAGLRAPVDGAQPDEARGPGFHDVVESVAYLIGYTSDTLGRALVSKNALLGGAILNTSVDGAAALSGALTEQWGNFRQGKPIDMVSLGAGVLESSRAFLQVGIPIATIGSIDATNHDPTIVRLDRAQAQTAGYFGFASAAASLASFGTSAWRRSTADNLSVMKDSFSTTAERSKLVEFVAQIVEGAGRRYQYPPAIIAGTALHLGHAGVSAVWDEYQRKDRTAESVALTAAKAAMLFCAVATTGQTWASARPADTPDATVLVRAGLKNAAYSSAGAAASAAAGAIAGIVAVTRGRPTTGPGHRSPRQPDLELGSMPELADRVTDAADVRSPASAAPSRSASPGLHIAASTVPSRPVSPDPSRTATGTPAAAAVTPPGSPVPAMSR